MIFIFTCRENGQTFESTAFEIIDNKGVKADDNGNRYLDAKVVLLNPCPFCGRIHSYNASELPCPF